MTGLGAPLVMGADGADRAATRSPISHPEPRSVAFNISTAPLTLLYNSLIAATTMADSKYYELYRRSRYCLLIDSFAAALR